MNNVIELFKRIPEEEKQKEYSAKSVLRLMLYSVAIQDHETTTACFGRLALQLDVVDEIKIPDTLKEKIDRIEEDTLLNYVTKHV